ncbi:MAG: hypothetical protein DRP00_05220, partial [Candidatus Aenigmatarchaeota archaeon]
TSGELFDFACRLAKERREHRNRMLEDRLRQEENEDLRQRITRLLRLNFKPKAAVVLKVEEVYSTMP